MAVTFPVFPSIDFSKLGVSQFDMPNIKLPQVDTEAITGAVKDAGYITVGLAVLAVQKAQVRRLEFRKSLNDQVGNGKSQLAEIVDAVEAGVASLDARLVTLETKLDGAVETVEQRLPAKVGAALNQAHEAVKVVRNQARTILTPAG